MINTMNTPSECSYHNPRDIENIVSICRDCGALLLKCRRCNTFYVKKEDSPRFLCTSCKFAVELPSSPIPVTSIISTSDSIDDALDEKESEPISVEQETITTKPTESQTIQTRDSRTITLTIRMWLMLMVISMVIGYTVSFI